MILKNRRYAALREFASVFGYRPEDPVAGTDLPDLDFVALAAGHAVRGVRVEDSESLRAALVQALQSPTPMLVEVEVA